MDKELMTINNVERVVSKVLETCCIIDMVFEVETSENDSAACFMNSSLIFIPMACPPFAILLFLLGLP